MALPLSGIQRGEEEEREKMGRRGENSWLTLSGMGKRGRKEERGNIEEGRRWSGLCNKGKRRTGNKVNSEERRIKKKRKE